MQEIWKDIPNFENLYQVSNYGRIKSLSRTNLVQYKDGSIRNKHTKEKILSLYDRGGYLHIKLCKNSIYTTYRISRLVLTIFNRPPKPGEDACHFPDKNTYNNNITNLVWASRQENISHTNIHGTRLLGEKTNNAKLSTQDIITIRKLQGKKSSKELSSIYKVSSATINRIWARKIWRHI